MILKNEFENSQEFEDVRIGSSDNYCMCSCSSNRI